MVPWYSCSVIVKAVPLLILMACGSEKAAGPKPDDTKPVVAVDATAAPADNADSRETMLAAMTKFTDRMCACTDRPCVTSVNDEMVKWTVEFSAKPAAGSSTPDQQKRIAEIGARYNQCSEKTLAANPPPPPPPPLDPKHLPASCVKFNAAVAAFAACDKMTPPKRKALLDQVANLQLSEQLCVDALKVIGEPAGRMGCKLPP